MNLKTLINKSVYGTIGYITSQNDINLLEQYILYNFDILKEYKQIIIATNFKEYPLLVQEHSLMWRKYFPDCILLNSTVNRGHSLGTADLDNMLFDYCKDHEIDWLCKSSNDMIFEQTLLTIQINDADFYYLNGIGFGGMTQYNFDFNRIIQEDFYPQTNFYFINVSKCDYLNDKNHITEIYNKINKLTNYNNKAWEYGFRSCEALLKETVESHNLLKFHLLSTEKYIILLDIIQKYQMHDPSHKNIMINGICHYHDNNQHVITI